MKKAKMTIEYDNSTTTFIRDYFEDCIEAIKEDIIRAGYKVKKFDKKNCIVTIKYPDGSIEKAHYLKKRVEYNEDIDTIEHLTLADFEDENPPKIWYTYFVKCRDGSLYAGVTTDPIQRERQHNGEIVGGAKYTKAKRPVKMVYIEPHFHKVASQQREYTIRKMTANKKKKMIKESNFLDTFKKNLKDK